MKAINNPIKFYSMNYLNDKCTFTFSETADYTKLCDFLPYDLNNLFVFTGTTGTITCSFNDKYSQSLNRDIDTIIIQNTNIKAMTIKYLDGSSVEQTLYTLTNNSDSEIRIDLSASVNISNIIFDITEVFTGTYIYIGQLRVCESIIELSATTQTSISDILQDGKIRTFNGKLIKWTDYRKWSASIQILNMSKTQYDLLKSFVVSDEFVSMEPFPEFETKDFYEVALSGLDYDISRWSGKYGFTLKAEAQENAYY